MGYTDDARIAMATAFAEAAEYIGLLTAGSGQSFTVKDAKTLKLAAHGLVDNDIVLVQGLPELEGQFCIVKKASVSEVELSSVTEAFAAYVWGINPKPSSVALTKYTELSGGGYKREKLKWEAAASRGVADETKKEVPAAEKAVVDAVGYWVKSKTEAEDALLAVEVVPHYIVTASKKYLVHSTFADLANI